MRPAVELGRDDWLWLLGSLCRISRVPLVNGKPVDLHSISLLTGFLETPHFLATVQAHPELLTRRFAGNFSNLPGFDAANLVDLLVQREYRGEGSLGALSVDVDKIDVKNGLSRLAGPAPAATDCRWTK